MGTKTPKKNLSILSLH